MTTSDRNDEETLARRQAAFPELVAELRPGIAELAAFLGVEEPAGDLEPVVAAADAFLASADFDEADEAQRVWLHTRLMYLAGETLVDRHGGYWFLDADPASPFYLRYVVQLGEPGPVVDPAELAHRELVAPPGERSLRRALGAVTP